jgi:molybdate transport system substrate-binding protein
MLAVLMTGCGRDTEARGQILVAAASDLAAAMPALALAFESQTGTAVTATLGSSGQIAAQIAAGAPVDVFLSADAGWIDRLEGAGRLEGGTRRVYAYGVLVLLAGRRAAPADIASLADAGYARIAIANPEHAPYGSAAAAALRSAGVYDVVAPRLVLAENVRQTVQFAETHAVDVAITALSLMDSARHQWTRVPGELQPPLVQTAAVVRGTSNSDAAAAFVAFTGSAEARAILQRFGFILP